MYAFANRCVLLLFITAVGLTSAVTQAQEPAPEGQQEPVLKIEEIVVSTSRLPSVEVSIYAVPSKLRSSPRMISSDREPRRSRRQFSTLQVL